MLSLSAITIGLVVLSHSLDLIKYKLKYILIQVICIFLYLIALIDGERGKLRPALFVILIATLLLIITYIKRGRKPGSNNV